MLKRDENKFCWYSNGKVGLPKDSIEEAIQDYLEEAKENGYSLDSIGLSNPYFFVPELSGRRIVDNLIYDFPNIMFNAYDKCITRRYIPHMEPQHIEELSKELSKIYYDWEKRHGYDNKSYIVFTEDIKIYPIR